MKNTKLCPAQQLQRLVQWRKQEEIFSVKKKKSKKKSCFLFQLNPAISIKSCYF